MELLLFGTVFPTISQMRLAYICIFKNTCKFWANQDIVNEDVDNMRGAGVGVARVGY